MVTSLDWLRISGALLIAMLLACGAEDDERGSKSDATFDHTNQSNQEKNSKTGPTSSESSEGTTATGLTSYRDGSAPQQRDGKNSQQKTEAFADGGRVLPNSSDASEMKGKGSRRSSSTSGSETGNKRNDRENSNPDLCPPQVPEKDSECALDDTIECIYGTLSCQCQLESWVCVESESSHQEEEGEGSQGSKGSSGKGDSEESRDGGSSRGPWWLVDGGAPGNKSPGN